MTDSDLPQRRQARRGARLGGDDERRDHTGVPRPHRCRRRRDPRLPARRRRGRPRCGARFRRATREGRDAVPARRCPDRGQGRARHQGSADHVWLEDPRGLGSAVRRDGGPAPEGGRTPDPRKDQHGRVRDGLLDRALGVRTDPQPVGPRPHPRRLRRWLGRGGGRLHGTACDRHRHRRLDPPARRRHRHGRGEADLRRGLPLRAGRDGQLARPGRTSHPHGARCRDAARDRRRPRPARLDEHRPAGPAGHRVGVRRGHG